MGAVTNKLIGLPLLQTLLTFKTTFNPVRKTEYQADNISLKELVLQSKSLFLKHDFMAIAFILEWVLRKLKI